MDDLLEADGILAQAQTIAVGGVRDWRAGQSATGSAAEDGVVKLPVVLETDEDG